MDSLQAISLQVPEMAPAAQAAVQNPRNGFSAILARFGKQLTAAAQKKNDPLQMLDPADLQQLAAMQILQNQTVPVVPAEMAPQIPELYGNAGIPAQPLENGQAAPEFNASAMLMADAAILPQPADQEKPAVFQRELLQMKGSDAQPAQNSPKPQTVEPELRMAEGKLAAQSGAENFGIQQPKENAKNQQFSSEAEQQPLFSQETLTPVKVSETPRPAELSHPESVKEQVIQKLKEFTSGGDRKIEIQLTPHNLGKIRVELTQKSDGTLHIALHAEHSEVRTLLERSLPELQQLLKSGSQQPVQIQVPQPQEDAQKQFYDGHQGQDHQQQPRQEQKKQQKSGQDFLNQLRLGLIPADTI